MTNVTELVATPEISTLRAWNNTFELAYSLIQTMPVVYVVPKILDSKDSGYHCSTFKSFTIYDIDKLISYCEHWHDLDIPCYVTSHFNNVPWDNDDGLY